MTFVDIQLILEFQNKVLENIIQSFLKIIKGRFFETPYTLYVQCTLDSYILSILNVCIMWTIQDFTD